jgi:hypothetical protein
MVPAAAAEIGAAHHDPTGQDAEVTKTTEPTFQQPRCLRPPALESGIESIELVA